MAELDKILEIDEFTINSFYKGKKRKRQEFIVVNTDKEFHGGHTHLKSLDVAKYLIQLVKADKINSGLSLYLLTSLKRMSNDVAYITRVDTLINSKKQKGKTMQYRNVGGRRA